MSITPSMYLFLRRLYSLPCHFHCPVKMYKDDEIFHVRKGHIFYPFFQLFFIHTSIYYIYYCLLQHYFNNAENNPKLIFENFSKFRDFSRTCNHEKLFRDYKKHFIPTWHCPASVIMPLLQHKTSWIRA